MRKAKLSIKIEDLGIKEIRPRRARTGALLLEIPGADKGQAADALAENLKRVLNDQEEVLITRPNKMAEIRIKDLGEWTFSEEVISAIATAGECPQDKIKVGSIRIAQNGLDSVWA